MRLLLALVVLTFVSQAFAMDAKIAIGGGFTFTEIDYDGSLGSGIDEEIGVGLNVGARVLIPMNEQWSFRTGAYLQEKALKYSFDSSGFEGDVTARIIQAAIPLNAQFQFNEWISAYGGYVLDWNINAYCSASGDIDSCSVGHNKQIVHNATLGASIKGNDKLDVDISYQRGLSDIFDKVKGHTFLAQLFVKF